MNERDTAAALSGVRPMHVRLLVTDAERALIRKAAQQPGWSVSTWATINLVQLAEIETSGSDA